MAKFSFKPKNDRVLRELVDSVYRDGLYDDGGTMDLVFLWAEYVNWLADEYKYKGRPIPEEERSALVQQFPLPDWYVTAMVSRLDPAQRKETMRLYNKELASYGFTEVGPSRVANPAGCAMTSGRLSSRSGSGSRSNSRHNDELSFTPSGRTARMLRRRNPLGKEYFIDESRGKIMSATQAKSKLVKFPDAKKFALQIKSGEDPLAIGGILAVATLKSENSKTGDCYVTSAAQQSCPNGKNNVYRCPFIEGNGCYAEQANQGVWTRILNKTAEAAEADSLEIAKAEAAALEKLAAYLNTYENGPSKLLRIHIVGDAVTADSARVIAEAAKPFVRRNAEIATLFSRNQEGRLIGNGGRGDSKVWAYTHGWRTVPREAWGEVSVLASCETQEDMEEAYAKGYALAAVVKKYDNEHLWDSPSKPQRWKAYPVGNFIILPCPNEAGDAKGTFKKCFECGLCLKDKMLRDKRMVIAFETHGSSTDKIDNVLVQIGANI